MINRTQQVMAHFGLQIVKRVNIILLCCLSFFISSCQSNINSNLIPNNFYQVSNDIYRSEQPSLKQIKQLDKFGIKTIINLRLWHSDRDKVVNTGITEVWINMRAGNISDKKIIQILKTIKNSPKPILIHCWHGSDRTGVVVAMYRLIFQNWSKRQVIDELMQPEFGHHYNIYPNIKNYINNVDVEQIRHAVFE
ncbi:protein tyrosine phosphatase [Gilliamella apicola]|uniref:Protein tyrosine phosphatase n=1 Tax=Gilliamella apicola TaxID=1196095 RepID=A0A556RP31_9GAMM|nr:tyrosine-protein phosphatase [Gilliamella apicola]TSJ90668.1 protein tyrosine phosphatase [Gilliamella apicola]